MPVEVTDTAVEPSTVMTTLPFAQSAPVVAFAPPAGSDSIDSILVHYDET